MMATGPLLLGVDVEVAESLEEQVPPPMWPMPRRPVPSPTEAATTIWGLFLHNGIITPRQELEEIQASLQNVLQRNDRFWHLQNMAREFEDALDSTSILDAAHLGEVKMLIYSAKQELKTVLNCAAVSTAISPPLRSTSTCAGA